MSDFIIITEPSPPEIIEVMVGGTGPIGPAGPAYTLPIASASELGGVTINPESGLSVDPETGELSIPTINRTFASEDAPNNINGSNNDIYIKSDGKIYEKANGAWDLLFTLASAAGTPSIKDFGAEVDGVTDDSGAVYGAIMSSTRCILFPEGSCYMAYSVTASPTSSKIFVGAGPECSIAGFSGDNGFVLTPVNTTIQIQFANMSVWALAAGIDNAIAITYPQDLSTITRTARIDNVDIKGYSTNYFTVGIRLINAHNSRITDCHINGKHENSLVIPGDVGILVEGGNDTIVSGTRAHFWKYSTLIQDYAEGLQIIGCKFEYTDFGVTKLHSTAAAPPHLSVIGTHINARRRCVLLQHVKQYFIDNCLFYTRDDQASPIGGTYAPDFAFIEIQQPTESVTSEYDSAMISNVTCFASTTYNSKAAINGFVAQNSKFLTMRDCSITGSATGAWLQSGTAYCNVENVQAIDTTSGNIDEGTLNTTNGLEKKIAATLTNNWVGYDVTVYYSRDKGGTVKIEGVIKDGTGNTAAMTLPVGYRPLQNRLFTMYSSAGANTVRINTDGTVVIPTGVSWITLDGISFRTT